MVSAEKLKQKKEFQCESCDFSSDLVGQLNRHVKLVHNYEPKACKEQGCDPNVFCQTLAKFSAHMRIHASFKPNKCLFPGCTHPVVYTTSMTYRKHLGTAHNVSERSEKDKYMPDYKPPFVAHNCRAEGCQSKQLWTAPGKLKQHLREKHEYSEDEVDAYFA